MLGRRMVPLKLRCAVNGRMRQRVGLFATGRAAFSQEGEDLVIARLLDIDQRPDGFYVDVGAHHPERFSNTMFFYQRGWRGINIDPMPGMAKEFAARRPRDINLEVAISENSTTIEYAVFNEPALNGCDMRLASTRNGKNGHRIVNHFPVQCRRLDEVLDEHMPADTMIDFLSVDVEGHDLSVLKSNAWGRYRPMLVLAEDIGVVSLGDLNSSAIAAFMRDVGYLPISKCAMTLIFADKARIRQTELGVRLS